MSSGKRIFEPVEGVTAQSVYDRLLELAGKRSVIVRDERPIPERVNALLGVQAKGLCFALKGRHYICVHGELPLDMRVFILAHELGHFMLHEKCGSGVFSDSGSSSKAEEEADVFARKLIALIARRLHEK